MVRNILVRYCLLNDDASYTQREEFLIEELHVPERWIHEAKVQETLLLLLKVPDDGSFVIFEVV